MSHSTAVHPAANTAVARNSGNSDSALGPAGGPGPTARRGGPVPPLVQVVVPGQLAPVVGLELLPVDVVRPAPGNPVLVPGGEERRGGRRPGQVARLVPAQPVQVQHVLVPQRPGPHVQEPHVQPARQERQAPQREQPQRPRPQAAVRRPGPVRTPPGRQRGSHDGRRDQRVHRGRHGLAAQPPAHRPAHRRHAGRRLRPPRARTAGRPGRPLRRADRPRPLS